VFLQQLPFGFRKNIILLCRIRPNRRPTIDSTIPKVCPRDDAVKVIGIRLAIAKAPQEELETFPLLFLIQVIRIKNIIDCVPKYFKRFGLSWCRSHLVPPERALYAQERAGGLIALDNLMRG